MKRLATVIILFFGLILCYRETRAEINLFGYSFQGNAFSDDAKVISGDVVSIAGWYGGEGTDIPGALNGSNLNTYIEGRLTGNTNSTFTVEAIYKDNYLFNGPGADLAVWERYNPEGFSLSIFDPSKNDWTAESFFQPVTVGYLYEDHAYREVNLALVDFGSFGLDPNVVISRIRIISNSTVFSPDIAALGGLNSHAVVPEPATLSLFGLGLLGLVIRRKR